MTETVLFRGVNLARDCRFKYVLMQLKDERKVVRGDASAEYHAEVAERARLPGAQVLGGGRIEVDAKTRKFKVYGYSVGFPWKGGISLNGETAALIQDEFFDWEVSWSAEGY